MSATTTPTIPKTLLDAVNDLLRAVRVAPVAGLLVTDLNADAQAAKQAIDGASIELQQQGWFFNTEEGVVLDPTVDGEIVLAENVLEVLSSRYRSSGNQLAHRGSRLYDPTKRTYAIGESVEVDIVIALDFSELPNAARLYVTALAARRFCLPRLPTNTTFAYTQEVLSTALTTLQQKDADARDQDLKATSPHFAKMGRR